MSKNDSFFTILELAVLFKVHPSTIRRSIKDKRIMTIRIGKGPKAAHRIPRSEIYRLSVFNLDEFFKEIIDDPQKLMQEKNKIASFKDGTS